MLHAQFYGAVFASLCVLYAMREDVRPALVVAYSYWVPQIVRNCREETKEPPFHAWYLYVTTLARLVLPVYALAWPRALLLVFSPHTEPRRKFVLLLVCWQFAQVAALKAQERLGPRFFVPPCLRPRRYDYHRPAPPLPPGDAAANAALPEALRREPRECVICFHDVDVSTPKAYLITPCDHVFHDECLSQWMQHKLECPTCRTALPPT